MKDKHQLYLTLCDQLAPYFRHDVQTMETDPETWKLARELDQWLYQYIDDPRVGEAQFTRVCDRLVALYVDTSAAVPLGEAAS